jgi:hypothetical protein
MINIYSSVDVCLSFVCVCFHFQNNELHIAVKQPLAATAVFQCSCEIMMIKMYQQNILHNAVK